MAKLAIDADFKAEFLQIRDRLRSAHEAGRGVRLTAREVQLLGLTFLGEWWNEDAEALDELPSYSE